MTGLLLVMALVVAIPLGIVAFVIMATPSRSGANQSRQAGSRGITALVFGVAALICQGGIAMGELGSFADLPYMLPFSLPAMAVAAVLAAAMHRGLVGGGQISAAFIGGAIALGTVFMVSVLLATAMGAAGHDLTRVGVFSAMMVLLQPVFGIPVALLGVGAGLLAHGMARRKPSKWHKATPGASINDTSIRQ
ncbi:UNVERIFIED_CONTAM: hypothetical protein C7454_1048 [Acidovorax defluvii]|jgi:hypothetical protein